MADDMQLKIGLDTTQAQQGIQGLSSGFDAIRGRVDKVKMALLATTATLTDVILAVKKLGALSNQQQGLLNLGVTPEYLKSINKELGNTVDQATLMARVQQSVAQGIDLSILRDAAKASAHMAKQFGISKQEMFSAVSAGKVQEGLLQRIGLSQKALNNEVAKMAASLGLGSGELDEATARTIRIKAIIAAVRKQTDGWKGSTTQAGDSAERMLVKLKDSAKELGLKLLPYMVRIIKATDSLLGYLGKVGKIYSEHKQEVKDIYNFFVGMGEAIKRNSALIQLAVAQFKVLTGTTDMALARIKAKTLQNEDAIHNGLKKKAAESAEKRRKQAEAQQMLAAKERKRLEIAAVKRLAEERKRQYLADLRALQDQALDLVRNFSEKIVQTVADAGGSFGTIASALTDVFEKTRTFASTGFGLKAINLVAKTIKDVGGDTNKDLIRQVQLRAKIAGVTGKAAQAAQLLAGWIRGGADDTAEFLANERSANAQLRAGLGTLQAQAKQAQLRTEQANLYKDVTAFQRNANTTINALQKRRNELLAQGGKSALAQAKIHDIIIQRLQRTSAQFGQIASQRRQILQAAMAHAKIEAQLEQTLKRQQQADELRGAKQRVGDARRRLAGLQGRGDAAGNIRAQAQQQTAALQSEISRMLAEARALAQKITAGGGTDGDQVRRLEQLNHMQKVIDLKRQEIDLIQQARDAEINRFSVAGQLQQQFAVTQEQFTANTVAKMKSQLSEMVGSFADNMTDVIVKIGQGDKEVGANFGKSTLEALGNLATQWGSFFVMQGAGMLASYQPTGAAVLAAGVGLTGLGIGLRAVSGLMSPAAGSPAVAGGTGSRPLDRIPGTEPDQNKNIRETFVLVNNVPWRKADAKDFTNMFDYFEEGGRMTGRRFAGV